ncbi:hypothetical protein PN36_30085 [Candidatus Thiomargarita nelsonii]|uniref:Uncharacterized protein n=1 Tax=Candidatus Thiomargarita nelsonii TaxID=1003181 RepID=A0A0A6PCD2_9GAMM|nr:hypothetical protein PN36_30085 [Candidatus Thiomargarita nelsonii]
MHTQLIYTDKKVRGTHPTLATTARDMSRNPRNGPVTGCILVKMGQKLFYYCVVAIKVRSRWIFVKQKLTCVITGG